MAKTFTLKDIKITDVNRDICANHVERLKELIKEHGYYEGLPIIVDEDGLIIDGQHRYLACKALKVEPTIVVDKSFDMVPFINSTQLSWTLRDYVKYYAAKGYEDFVILEQICKSKKISPNTAFAIMFNKVSSRTGLQRKSAKNPLKDGTFKIPDKSDKGLAKLERKIDAVLRTVSLLGLPRTDRLLLAIARLAEDNNFSFKVMEKKIEYQKARIYRCATIQEYKHMLSSIYNYKNTKKIAV